MITNKHFTDEQMEKYASAFKEGDAIWRGGRWNEVKSLVKTFDFVGSGGTVRRITTLEHYKPQGGEKIVWLGKSDSRRYFGECFYVIRYNNSFIYQNKVGYALVYGDDWGIIPSYKQVAEQSVVTNNSRILTIKEALKDDINLIPDAIEASLERDKVLNEVRNLLKHINEGISFQKYIDTAEIEFETVLAPQKAKEVEVIVKEILIEKGYQVESVFKTEQEEGYSSVEYISTIKLVINW